MKAFAPLLMLLVLAMPVASALPIQVQLPTACGGSLVGCANILSPLLEPTAAIPALQPPANEAPEAPAPVGGSAAQTASDGQASPPPARTPPGSGGSWTWRPFGMSDAMLAAIVAHAVLVLLTFAIVLNARDRPKRQRDRAADMARAQALQRAAEAAWRDARPTAAK